MQVFVAENPESARPLVELLQKEVTAHKDKDFKAFILFTSASPADVEKLASSVNAPGVALCTLKGPDDDALSKYGINVKDASVKSTAIVYKDRLVTANLINPKLPDLSQAIAAVCK